jgi:hypothetical protein
MSVVANPFLNLVQNRNFLFEWLRGAWKWPLRKTGDRRFTRTQAAAELFDRWFYDGTRCSSLPEKPVLILNATSLHSIRSWRFTQGGLGDSRIGHASWGNHPMTLGTCVGASAAFPPVFPPMRVERAHYAFSGPLYGEPELRNYDLIPLSDGGVYDNSGLEVLIKSVKVPGNDERLELSEFLVVSDGGAVPNYRFNPVGLPGLSDALLLYRVDEIAREQVSALRSRSLIAEFLRHERTGLFVSLRSSLAKMGAVPFACYAEDLGSRYLIPADLVDLIKSVRTSLDRFSRIETTALMYHAYSMTDAFRWCYRDTFATEYQIGSRPSPKWRIDFCRDQITEWRLGLKDSAGTLRIR